MRSPPHPQHDIQTLLDPLVSLRRPLPCLPTHQAPPYLGTHIAQSRLVRCRAGRQLPGSEHLTRVVPEPLTLYRRCASPPHLRLRHPLSLSKGESRKRSSHPMDSLLCHKALRYRMPVVLRPRSHVFKLLLSWLTWLTSVQCHSQERADRPDQVEMEHLRLWDFGIPHL
jgi:hypothetical protein